MTSTGIARAAAVALALATALPAVAETHSGTWSTKLQDERDIFRNGGSTQLRVVVTVCLDPASPRGIGLHKRSDNSFGTFFILLKGEGCHTHVTTMPSGYWMAVRPRDNAESEVKGTYQVSW